MARVRLLTFIVLTALLVVTLPLAGAELLLRALGRPVPLVSGWRAPVNEQLRMQRNELGYRGQPIEYGEDDTVVLLVGDSQVEAMACAYEWMPERRLEAHLGARSGRRVHVFSLGAGGYGQDQQLLALREYLARYRADVVINWETPGNDLWNITFPTMDPDGLQPKPTFWLENGELRGPSSQMGEIVSPRMRLVSLIERRWPLRLPDEEWETRLPPPYKPMEAYRGPVNRTWQERFDENLGTIPTDNFATEKSHMAIFLEPRSPRTGYSATLMHLLLQQMASAVQSRGGRFMTYWVDVPSVDLPEPEAVYSLNGRYYRASRRQALRTLAEANAGFATHVSPLPMAQWRVSPVDGHLNEHAVDMVMQDLAAAVTPLVAQ